MFEMSLAEALSSSWQDHCRQLERPGHYFFYIIQDESTTLYIGRTRTPWKRLQQHLGLHNKSARPSRVGKTIRDNSPQSLAWTIKFLTLEEAAPLIAQHISSERYEQLLADSAHQPTLLALAEQALIDKHHPRLNSRAETYDLTVPTPERYTNIPDM